MESKDQKINQELNSGGELSWVLNPALLTKMYLGALAEPSELQAGFVFIFLVKVLFLFSPWWFWFYFPQEKPLPALHSLSMSWHQAQPALLLLTMLHTLGMYLLTAQELQGPPAIRVFNISVTCADKRTSKSSRASPATAMPLEASGQAQ